MNWYTLFYLFSILEKLTIAMTAGAVICTIGYVVFSAIHFTQKYEMIDNITEPDGHKYKESEKWVKTVRAPRTIFFIIGILSYLALIFTPNRKDVILIIAGGAVGQFITTDSSARKLPADITKFLHGEIMKATSELTDEAKQSVGIDTQAERIKKATKEELEKMLLDKINNEGKPK